MKDLFERADNHENAKQGGVIKKISQKPLDKNSSKLH
jgi:hypothetical protein